MPIIMVLTAAVRLTTTGLVEVIALVAYVCTIELNNRYEAKAIAPEIAAAKKQRKGVAFSKEVSIGSLVELGDLSFIIHTAATDSDQRPTALPTTLDSRIKSSKPLKVKD